MHAANARAHAAAVSDADAGPQRRDRGRTHVRLGAVAVPGAIELENQANELEASAQEKQEEAEAADYLAKEAKVLAGISQWGFDCYEHRRYAQRLWAEGTKDHVR